jgi:hypothetical protein
MSLDRHTQVSNKTLVMADCAQPVTYRNSLGEFIAIAFEIGVALDLITGNRSWN